MHDEGQPLPMQPVGAGTREAAIALLQARLGAVILRDLVRANDGGWVDRKTRERVD